jgi:hypothetical protein
VRQTDVQNIEEENSLLKEDLETMAESTDVLNLRCFLDSTLGKMGYQGLGHDKFISSKYAIGTPVRRVFEVLKQRETYVQAYCRSQSRSYD